MGESSVVVGLLVWAIQTLVFIAIPIGLFLFARRFLRAYERRSTAPDHLREVLERLRCLEERVEEIADEQRRLAEGNRFVADVLSGRGADRDR